MFKLVMMITYSCPMTLVINFTNTFTEFDKQTLKRAQVRCGEIYEDAPCATTFIKKEELLYQVVCSAPKIVR